MDISMTKTLNTIILLTFLLLCSGCYSGISGKVVDGVNGKPLEGAVVLAQWTKTHGFPGLISHTVYKIEETETDKEGVFSIAGVYNLFVDPPEMVIYKKGYVPWRNDMDFMNPTWKHYEKNKWQNNFTYKLAPWKEEYSKMMLDGFVNVGFMTFKVNNNDIPKFSELQKVLRKDAQPEIELKWKPKK
jgi:hypothetical protein